MAGEHEPAKALLPYLQRADELQKHEPLVAYYCRLYAMDRGLRIPQNERTKTTNALLSSLIKQLEKDKKSLNLCPEDNLHLEGFALNVFAKADKQDRAGRADLNTAKTFYAASIFFEIINQFGPLQPDLEEKQKYAAWKAADIRKALKEGRKPVPGPPAGEDDLSLPSTTPTESFGLGIHIGAETDSSPQTHERLDRQHSTNSISGSSLSSIPPNYPSQDFHQPLPPPITKAESSVYSSPYHQVHHPQEHDLHLPENYPLEHLPPNYPSEHVPQGPHNYASEPQQHLPYNYSQQPQQHLSSEYPSPENTNPPNSYPHFQSYSSLPSIPSQDPYYKAPESSYSSQSAHSAEPYPSVPQYGSNSRNGAVSGASHAPAPQMYQYDSNYQPTPEKIADAQKAARFAVGALAFDEVFVAVEHLRTALELLTNPSAGS